MIDEWFVKSRFFKNPNIRSSLWHLVFFTKSMFWRRLITMMICIGVFLTLLETHRGILLYVAYLNSSLIQGIWNIGTYLFIFVLPLYSVQRVIHEEYFNIAHINNPLHMHFGGIKLIVTFLHQFYLKIEIHSVKTKNRLNLLKIVCLQIPYNHKILS